MPPLASRALTVAATAFSVACYQTYTGIYWIRGDHPITVHAVNACVLDATRDLGFRRKEAGDFGKYPESLPMDGVRIEGDQAAVGVAVSDDPISITLRDYSNRRETEFTREVKRRIEQCLLEEYGLTDLEFRRQLEFVPN